jgi:hypothetical protein
VCSIAAIDCTPSARCECLEKDGEIAILLLTADTAIVAPPRRLLWKRLLAAHREHSALRLGQRDD